MVDQAPKVSVVITAYNAEQWIAATLDSVISQSFQDMEVVVVDDGSTDGTAAVVRRYPPPVRYIHQENRGQPAARNAGIRAARGRYVAFVDADDLWLPEKLARQMALFDEDPELEWAYSDAYLFDSESDATMRTASQVSELREGDVLQYLIRGNFIPSPTPVVRRDVFASAGYFDESPHVQSGGGEDWDMWLRIAERHPVGVVRKPLARYRIHRTSMLQSMDIKTALDGRLRVLEGVFNRNPGLAPGLRSRAVANQYLIAGRWMLARGMKKEARVYLLKALRGLPRSLSAWTFLIASFVPVSLRKRLGALRSRWWKLGLPVGQGSTEPDAADGGPVTASDPHSPASE